MIAATLFHAQSTPLADNRLTSETRVISSAPIDDARQERLDDFALPAPHRPRLIASQRNSPARTTS